MRRSGLTVKFALWQIREKNLLLVPFLKIEKMWSLPSSPRTRTPSIAGCNSKGIPANLFLPISVSLLDERSAMV